MKTFIFTIAVMTGLLASSCVLADPYNTDNGYSNGLEQGPTENQDISNSAQSDNKNALDIAASRDGETMGEED